MADRVADMYQRLEDAGLPVHQAAWLIRRGKLITAAGTIHSGAAGIQRAALSRMLGP